MELELKHIAPYLPYGLRVAKKLDWHTEDWDNPEILIMVQLCECEADWFYIGARPLDTWNRHINSENNQFKPILRPLSDLTKEIEHNGEKFVAGLKLVDPENEEWDKMKCEEYNAFPKIPNYPKWIQVIHEDLGQVISINPRNIEHLPYSLFKVIIEWHFDVFGLIEAGLAIDINTITKK